MAKHILVNAFSLNMLPLEAMNFVWVKKINPEEVPTDVESAIGHTDTAKVVSGILGFEVKPNRVSIKLTESDVLYVAQYTGPRLPEGATTLPEGASLEFFEVTFLASGWAALPSWSDKNLLNTLSLVAMQLEAGRFFIL